MSVRVQEQNSKEIPLERGVSQGDVISPKLFRATTEDAFKLLQWQGCGININSEDNTPLICKKYRSHGKVDGGTQHDTQRPQSSFVAIVDSNMSLSAAALTLVQALQITFPLLSKLNLDGSLYPRERIIANNSCFDYIIVGGGTAGCAVAARLSENPNVTVLLLEAGKNPPILNFFPPAFALFPGSEFDYNFTSILDNYAASSQYGFTKLSAGKCLGGTSSINHFIEARGSAEDYNTIAKNSGDESWNYTNVLPYFKKKEKLVDDEILDSIYRDNHGLDGPNAITRQVKEYGKKYIEALNETGSRTPLDITQAVSIGFTQSLFIVDKLGIRQNTAYTYLSKIKLRPNLYVRRNSFVTRIIFEKNRAVAVLTVKDGKTYIFRASREIIICAGVFNSPKLLLLSGVGPKKDLKALNIPVVVDLPVGRNFQDQIAISLVHKMEFSILPPPLTSLLPNEVPFPVIVGLEALNRTQLFADYQVFMLPLYANTPFLLLACAVIFQFRSDLCDKFNTANVLHNTLYTLLLKAQPKSTGYVKLRTADPFNPPLIKTGYLTNPNDLEDMVSYIVDYLKVEKSNYFRSVGAKLVDPKFKKCTNYKYRSRNYWRCYVKHTAGSAYHNCGTCSMGLVVDSKLRVYNVTSLRVIDASVIPFLLSGSPYEEVLMFAEKGADMIKEDLDNEPSCSELYGYGENYEDTSLTNDATDTATNSSVSDSGTFNNVSSSIASDGLTSFLSSTI